MKTKFKNILITGGSGLIGRVLTPLLQAKGHKISWLSRSGISIEGVKGYRWDIEKMTIDREAVEFADVIVHLAGEGIANGRWTVSQKKKILDSRTQSTRLLCRALSEEEDVVSQVISASAIGYYGMDNGDRILTEDDQSGDDFLAEVTSQWEQEVDQIASPSINATKLRLGVVLTAEGGALEKMSMPIRWGVGAALGTGDQYMSWIHVDDLCSMIMYLLENNTPGVYNAVTPYPVTNSEMTKAIAGQLNRRILLPNIPRFVLKIMLGEMVNMLLGSSKVSSSKIQKEGFQFRYPTLESALKNLIR